MLLHHHGDHRDHGDDHGDTDAGGLDPRRWVLMACAWSLVLVPWLVVSATLDAPVALRVALVLAVLAYAACYVLGLLVAMRRRRPAFSAGLIVVMAALWAALVTGLGSDPDAARQVLYTVSFLVVAVLALLPPVPGFPMHGL